MSTEIEKAMKVLTEAMQDTELGSYAHSWHCNIAMSVYDSLNGREQWRHKVSNAAATRFMKLCFDVDTKND